MVSRTAVNKRSAGGPIDAQDSYYYLVSRYGFGVFELANGYGVWYVWLPVQSRVLHS